MGAPMQGNINLDEEMVKIEESIDRYFKAYKPQMEALEGSPLAKHRGGSPGVQDYYALGKQLDQYEIYMALMRHRGMISESNTNALGLIPNVAWDVITAVMGSSVIPIIATIQPELRRAA